MTKDEAFNRCWSKYYKEHSWNYMDEELSSDLAYYFWKSALEQPTQEPVAYFKKWEDKSGEHKDIKFSNSEGYKPLYTHPAPQPTTQEPVASRFKLSDGNYSLHNDQYDFGEPLYTHPPKEWVSLSDDEIWNIANFLGKNKEWDYPVMFAKTIEKALKEKNNE